MMTRHTILLAAGGTGGHMFPAFALADALRGRGYGVQLITDTRGQRFVPSAFQDVVHPMRAGTVTRGGVMFRLLAGFGVVQGVWDAIRVIRKNKISLVVGFGGYPVFPVMLAARLLGIPYVVHEQNTVLGRVNRLVAKSARAIALSFEKTMRVPKGVTTVLTGNPVRDEIRAIGDMAYLPARTNAPFELLVIGGSQGARLFSDVLPAAIRLMKYELLGHLHITQQCRPEDVDRVKESYAETSVKADVSGFITDMARKIDDAKLIITRAGATSLAEILTASRPALYVPLKIAADDHQTSNADVVVEAKGGWAMSEDDFTPSKVAAFLEDQLQAPIGLGEIAKNARLIAHPDAAEKLADLVERELPTGQTRKADSRGDTATDTDTHIERKLVG